MENYDRIRTLGRGAAGVVRLYRNIKTNESYAIKEISIDGLKEEDISKKENEAKVLKKINSYYVVKCYDSFKENLNSLFNKFKLFFCFRRLKFKKMESKGSRCS